MKKNNRFKGQLAGVLGMIALLALTTFASMAGGFLQQYHRSNRQRNLRREKFHLTAIRIVLPESELGRCFSRKKNELDFNGLRYDVVSVEQQGNNLIFKAIPDIKETQICAFALRSLLFPDKNGVEKTQLASLLYYLPGFIPPLPLPCLAMVAQSDFADPLAVLLPGFEWKYSPPPEPASNFSC